MSDTDILHLRVRLNHVLEELRGPRTNRIPAAELSSLLSDLRDQTNAALARLA